MTTAKSNAVLSSTVPAGKLVESDGTATRAFLKWLQNNGIIINQNFNVLNQITGTVAPGSIVASTDNLTDGIGSPLAGGKEAYTALVDSTPTSGEVLGWNGTDWVPVPTVAKLLAGAGIAVSPVGGEGDVTVSSTATAGYSLGGTLTTANVVVGAGAGAGATVTAVAGLDGTHAISLTTGTGPVLNGVLFTVTFTTSRGHVTYPVNKCVVVSVGHALIDFSTGASASATGYVASNTGVDASTSYTWNISAP